MPALIIREDVPAAELRRLAKAEHDLRDWVTLYNRGGPASRRR
jgi:hypothetical protein